MKNIEIDGYGGYKIGVHVFTDTMEGIGRVIMYFSLSSGEESYAVANYFFTEIGYTNVNILSVDDIRFLFTINSICHEIALQNLIIIAGIMKQVVANNKNIKNKIDVLIYKKYNVK